MSVPASSSGSSPVTVAVAAAMSLSRTEPGEPVQQRDAEQEERRGERPEQEVLHRGLLRQQATAPGQAGEQVQRQREHLERDEHRQQVAGGGEDHHPAGREQHERVHLGLRQPLPAGDLLVVRAGDGGGLRGERVLAGLAAVGDEQQRDEREQRDHPLQDERRPVEDHRAAEHDGPAGVPDVRPQRRDRDHGARGRGQGEAELHGPAACAAGRRPRRGRRSPRPPGPAAPAPAAPSRSAAR